MKSKKLLILILGLMCLTFLSQICSAQQADVTITDVSVQLLKTRAPVGNTVIHEYKIIAVLHNSGDAQSVSITVKFKEPQPGLGGNYTLQPESYILNASETKTFVFENWPTPLAGDVPINVSFGPTSSNILPNSYNSGYSVYTLAIGSKKTTSTPGFEVAFLLLGIVVLLLSRKMKKQR